MTRLNIKLEKQTPNKRKPYLDLTLLNNIETRQSIKNKINGNLKNIIAPEMDIPNNKKPHINNKWEALKSALTEPSEIIRVKKTLSQKQEWMTTTGLTRRF